MSLRLLLRQPLQADTELTLPAKAARHVQVRRLQPGDELLLFNGEGGQWAAQVLHMGRQAVSVSVRGWQAAPPETMPAVTLALGMPANERMDWLVEKATELGVSAIQPLQCERSVLRAADERAQRKREHWQAVADAACEQSGRTQPPEVLAVQALAPWLASLHGDAQRLLLAAQAEPLRALARPGASVLFLSGPEGGLAPAEQALALRHGFAAVSLGPRVLRAETAPLAALAWLALQQP